MFLQYIDDVDVGDRRPGTGDPVKSGETLLELVVEMPNQLTGD